MANASLKPVSGFDQIKAALAAAVEVDLVPVREPTAITFIAVIAVAACWRH